MREMKDSGVAWIGEVPLDWTIIPTKYLFNIESGATPRSENPDYFDGDIVWITPADYKTKDVYISAGKRYLTKNGFDSCSAVVVPAGSIIFTKRAPIGNVAICATELCTNQGCLSCVPKAGDSTKFFYYLMSICTDAYNLLGSGTTFKEISAFSFANFILIRPMLQEQQKIAAYLDKQTAQVDALITNIQTQIEKLKDYKQSMITEVVTKGLEPTVPMKDSGVEWIGNIPTRWTANKIIRCFGVIGSGTTPKSADDALFEGDINWIQSGDINGSVLSETRFQITRDIVEETSALKVYSAPFIVIAMYGASIGNLSISQIDACTNQACCVLSKPVNGLLLKYLFYAFKPAKGYLIWRADGGGQPNISQEKLKSLWIPIPPNEDQVVIVQHLNKKCGQIDRLITLKQSKIEKLEQYKRSIIYEYVTGKREVS